MLYKSLFETLHNKHIQIAQSIRNFIFFDIEDFSLKKTNFVSIPCLENADIDLNWKSRNSFVIESIENGKRYLLPLSYYKNYGFPDDFLKKTSVIPIPESYWQQVKYLPVYKK